jgi:hypothetical protein
MEKKFFLWRRTQRVDGATVYPAHKYGSNARKSKTRYTRTFTRTCPWAFLDWCRSRLPAQEKGCAQQKGPLCLHVVLKC